MDRTVSCAMLSMPRRQLDSTISTPSPLDIHGELFSTPQKYAFRTLFHRISREERFGECDQDRVDALRLDGERDMGRYEHDLMIGSGLEAGDSIVLGSR